MDTADTLRSRSSPRRFDRFELCPRPDEKSLGVGEGAQGATAAAIANASVNATGRRIRDLPFTPARVKAALA